MRPVHPLAPEEHGASGPRTLGEYERAALERLAGPVADYLLGGAADEHTLRANTGRFADIRLAPRVLTDVRHLDTSAEVPGIRLEHPVMLAPTGAHRLFHPRGELATAEGAAQAGAAYVVSSYSTTSFAEIAAATDGPLWFQLNPLPDPEFQERIVRDVAALGARAVVVTVDTPVPGTRNRQRWNGLDLPEGLTYPMLGALAGLRPKAGAIHRPALDAGFGWADLARLIAACPVPVVVKGVLRGDDAARLVDLGVAAVWVSNHGGRNLDTAPAAIDALPHVASAVAGRVPVLLDGGVRRGTDVLKALALGACAVLIGRPALCGLAVGGAAGVRHVVDVLRTELEMAMALCGVTTVREVTTDVLWPVREREWV
ncbi:alpha-hydroxy acid oxidase [Prauserella flavalba]|uniref:alpha-hydroxy acid oxidase n=1 Tax=Prauserella flavalba TaxID=1477506 RepID=UPI0036E8396D